MGDKSDNIPSVLSKCGIKTAIKCYDDPKMSCIYQNGNVKTRTTTLFTLQNILNHKELNFFMI